MRGLAQLKQKLDNPDAVRVYKTSGMRIEHLIPRLKGYICEDTNAVVLHLGTNDISGSVNKVKEDINRLAVTTSLPITCVLFWLWTHDKYYKASYVIST